MFPQSRAIKQLSELKKYTSELRLAAEWPEPWQCLISTALSARTRDEVTIEVCEHLFKKYNSPQKLAKAKLSDIEKLIRPVNFYRNKSKNIIGCAKMLVKEYDGIPPHDLNKLIELPGVGRKTANVFLSEMGKDAIGVDTHVSQIAQKLGWSKNTNAHKIEEDLKQLFPRNIWSQVNETLVLVGRTHRGKKQIPIIKKIMSIK